MSPGKPGTATASTESMAVIPRYPPMCTLASGKGDRSDFLVAKSNFLAPGGSDVRLRGGTYSSGDRGQMVGDRRPLRQRCESRALAG